MSFSIPVIDGLFGVGEKLIDRLFPDPQEKAKAQAELVNMRDKGELSRLSMAHQAITAEAKSTDPWTSRARPMFMYTFYLILLNLTIVAPALGVFFPEQMTTFFTNVKLGFVAIPEPLWWLFGSGYLGYTTARTVEKRGAMPKFN